MIADPSLTNLVAPSKKRATDMPDSNPTTKKPRIAVTTTETDHALIEHPSQMATTDISATPSPIAIYTPLTDPATNPLPPSTEVRLSVTTTEPAHATISQIAATEIKSPLLITPPIAIYTPLTDPAINPLLPSIEPSNLPIDRDLHSTTTNNLEYATPSKAIQESEPLFLSSPPAPNTRSKRSLSAETLDLPQNRHRRRRQRVRLPVVLLPRIAWAHALVEKKYGANSNRRNDLSMSVKDQRLILSRHITNPFLRFVDPHFAPSY